MRLARKLFAHLGSAFRNIESVLSLLRFGVNLSRSERFSDLLSRELLVPEADPNSTIISALEAINHLPALEAGAVYAAIPNHRTLAV